MLRGPPARAAAAQIKKPSHRLDELEKLTRAKLARDSSIELHAAHLPPHAARGDASEAHLVAGGGGPSGVVAGKETYGLPAGDLPVGVTGSSVALIGGGAGAAGASGLQDGGRAGSGGGGGQARVAVAVGGEQSRSGSLLDRIVNLVSAPGGGKGTHAH